MSSNRSKKWELPRRYYWLIVTLELEVCGLLWIMGALRPLSAL